MRKLVYINWISVLFVCWMSVHRSVTPCFCSWSPAYPEHPKPSYRFLPIKSTSYDRVGMSGSQLHRISIWEYLNRGDTVPQVTICKTQNGDNLIIHGIWAFQLLRQSPKKRNHVISQSAPPHPSPSIPNPPHPGAPCPLENPRCPSPWGPSQGWQRRWDRCHPTCGTRPKGGTLVEMVDGGPWPQRCVNPLAKPFGFWGCLTYFKNSRKGIWDVETNQWFRFQTISFLGDALEASLVSWLFR